MDSSDLAILLAICLGGLLGGYSLFWIIKLENDIIPPFHYNPSRDSPSSPPSPRSPSSSTTTQSSPSLATRTWHAIRHLLFSPSSDDQCKASSDSSSAHDASRDHFIPSQPYRGIENIAARYRNAALFGDPFAHGLLPPASSPTSFLHNAPPILPLFQYVGSALLVIVIWESLRYLFFGKSRCPTCRALEKSPAQEKEVDTPEVTQNHVDLDDPLTLTTIPPPRRLVFEPRPVDIIPTSPTEILSRRQSGVRTISIRSDASDATYQTARSRLSSSSMQSAATNSNRPSILERWSTPYPSQTTFTSLPILSPPTPPKSKAKANAPLSDTRDVFTVTPYNTPPYAHTASVEDSTAGDPAAANKSIDIDSSSDIPAEVLNKSGDDDDSIIDYIYDSQEAVHGLINPDETFLLDSPGANTPHRESNSYILNIESDMTPTPATPPLRATTVLPPQSQSPNYSERKTSTAISRASLSPATPLSSRATALSSLSNPSVEKTIMPNAPYASSPATPLHTTVLPYLSEKKATISRAPNLIISPPTSRRTTVLSSLSNSLDEKTIMSNAPSSPATPLHTTVLPSQSNFSDNKAAISRALSLSPAIPLHATMLPSEPEKTAATSRAPSPSPSTPLRATMLSNSLDEKTIIPNALASPATPATPHHPISLLSYFNSSEKRTPISNNNTQSPKMLTPLPPFVVARRRRKLDNRRSSNESPPSSPPSPPNYNSNTSPMSSPPVGYDQSPESSRLRSIISLNPNPNLIMDSPSPPSPPSLSLRFKRVDNDMMASPPSHTTPPHPLTSPQRVCETLPNIQSPSQNPTTPPRHGLPKSNSFENSPNNRFTPIERTMLHNRQINPSLLEASLSIQSLPSSNSIDDINSNPNSSNNEASGSPLPVPVSPPKKPKFSIYTGDEPDWSPPPPSLPKLPPRPKFSIYTGSDVGTSGTSTASPTSSATGSDELLSGSDLQSINENLMRRVRRIDGIVKRGGRLADENEYEEPGAEDEDSASDEDERRLTHEEIIEQKENVMPVRGMDRIAERRRRRMMGLPGVIPLAQIQEEEEEASLRSSKHSLSPNNSSSLLENRPGRRVRFADHKNTTHIYEATKSDNLSYTPTYWALTSGPALTTVTDPSTGEEYTYTHTHTGEMTIEEEIEKAELEMSIRIELDDLRREMWERGTVVFLRRRSGGGVDVGLSPEKAGDPDFGFCFDVDEYDDEEVEVEVEGGEGGEYLEEKEEEGLEGDYYP